ncbi:MAG: hypothetical protein QNJ48_01825 [Desulfobacterales bacterium]|nr:hypothetical protein [Desulfobacterales bacterium]MDJ0873704.1 hypothetical protein [Desulfobacterales bacterium]MDJ0882865.1 hypothetical protein [Desulfobacterales bacterium]
MDHQFFKFWGEFLLQAADGQRQLEELTRWISEGFSPSSELADLFRKCYGLPAFSPPESATAWQKATADFDKAFKAYAPLWGWVPLERYDQLKREKERLEAQIADQARFIRQLEAILEDKDLGHMGLITRFQNLVTDQSRAFDDLMQALQASPEVSDDAERK